MRSAGGVAREQRRFVMINVGRVLLDAAAAAAVRVVRQIVQDLVDSEQVAAIDGVQERRGSLRPRRRAVLGPRDGDGEEDDAGCALPSGRSSLGTSLVGHAESSSFGWDCCKVGEKKIFSLKQYVLLHA